MKVSRGVRAAGLWTALLILPSVTHGQSCVTGGGLALLATAGRVEQAAPLETSGLAFGARLEWSPTTAVAARGSYQRTDLDNDQALHTAAVGGVMRLPVPGRPCVTVDVLLSSGGSLGPDDHYRNVTLPLGIVLAYPLNRGTVTLTPSLGAHALFSATDARLLSFDVERQAWGYSAIASARLAVSRILTEISVRATDLAGSVGPQPLGRFRADLSLGFRL